MVVYKNGDLLHSDCNVICHQTNCRGVMGAGIALQIRRAYPRAYEKFLDYHQKGYDKLGNIGICYTETAAGKPQYIVNLYSQEDYRPQGVCHTDYISFMKCLEKLKAQILHNERNVTPKTKFKIGFPDHIGCGLAGGDWDIIKGIILDEFKDDHWKVEIWKRY